MSGALAGLIALILVAGGCAALWLDTQRHPDGFLSTDPQTYTTRTFAIVSDHVRAGPAWDLAAPVDVLGNIRLRVSSAHRLFVGIGPAAAVDDYLASVPRQEVIDLDVPRASRMDVPGGRAPDGGPVHQRFWAVWHVGAGEQSLTWRPHGGHWRVVVMRPDGRRDITAVVSIGARFPHLVRIGAVALLLGLILGLLAPWLVVRGVRAHRCRAPAPERQA